jgi:putative tryptophan/tyrosine transport system substrate-binding protein
MIMRRRDFLWGIGGSIVATRASFVYAQRAGPVDGPRRKLRIGILVFGSSSDPPVEAPFVDGLRDLGWIDGKNIVIERRYANNRLDRLQAIANELVRAKVDVLAAPGTDLSDAAKNATTTIPVVMGASADPVEKGLVASLAHPGGNVTGMAFMSPQLSPKRLELLKEAIPGVVRVAVLWDPTYSDMDFKALQAAASALELQILSLEVRGAEEIDKAIRAATAAQALVVTPSRFTFTYRQRILDLANANHLPTIASWRYFADTGGLIIYGPNLPDMFRRVMAKYVDKILRGANPRDLPVEQPTKFELVINLKTAKALGLTIPPSLLARADEVIE